ncbi:MAG: Hsp20/alpha crystallin family protein [Promethearchaeota archaeon]
MSESEKPESEKYLVRPEMSACLDDKGENYLLDVVLPGVKKEVIDISMHDDVVQVIAEKDELVYAGHLHFGLKVIPEQAKANYDNGLLKMTIPLKEKRAPPVKVKVE